MKKVILSIVVIAFVGFALVLANPQPIENGGIPINDGNVCVCKSSKCQKGGLLLLNKQCAYVYGGATDANCGLTGGGNCN